MSLYILLFLTRRPCSLYKRKKDLLFTGYLHSWSEQFSEKIAALYTPIWSTLALHMRNHQHSFPFHPHVIKQITNNGLDYPLPWNSSYQEMEPGWIWALLVACFGQRHWKWYSVSSEASRGLALLFFFWTLCPCHVKKPKLPCWMLKTHYPDNSVVHPRASNCSEIEAFLKHQFSANKLAVSRYKTRPAKISWVFPSSVEPSHWPIDLHAIINAHCFKSLSFGECLLRQ